MNEMYQIKEALLKSAAKIRDQKSTIKRLENELEKKSSSFNSPENIKETLIKSAKTIRNLKEKVNNSNVIEKKAQEYDSFLKSLEVTSELARKGLISWEDLIEKTAELQKSDKLDAVRDSLKYVGAPVDTLFSAELSKKASSDELDGEAATEEFNEWIMS